MRSDVPFRGIFLSITAIGATLAAVTLTSPPDQETPAVKGKRKSRLVQPTAASPNQPAVAAAPPAGGGFAAQTRLGFAQGDQWEPAIAADRAGNVYVLYPQYLTVPGCPTCPSPTMVLQVSNDDGATWGAPVPISDLIASPPSLASPGTGQWDAQIVVDPVPGPSGVETVYATWMQDNKSTIVVARSDDRGASWTATVASSSRQGMDKPILVARGGSVHVAYNHANKLWFSSSADGGASFSSTPVNSHWGWSLATGGTIDPAGNIYFAWSGYSRNGSARGPVNLYFTRSTDGGRTWKIITDPRMVSAAAPTCVTYQCGWAYLGPQVVVESDAGGTLYALFNKGTVDMGPEQIYFSSSSDLGATWSDPVKVSTAGDLVSHAFPAIAAGAAGDVRIAWMDARVPGTAPGPLWNTWHRSSRDGGATWSAEQRLSSYAPGFSYIFDAPVGFSFPFGDYFELAIGRSGETHAVFGEGLNYDSPGSIWYTSGR